MTFATLEIDWNKDKQFNTFDSNLSDEKQEILEMANQGHSVSAIAQHIREDDGYVKTTIEAYRKEPDFHRFILRG